MPKYRTTVILLTPSRPLPPPQYCGCYGASFDLSPVQAPELQVTETKGEGQKGSKGSQHIPCDNLRFLVKIRGSYQRCWATVVPWS